MMNRLQRNISLSEVHGSIDTTTHGRWWKQLFVFFGPAYLISVGYMDPGNWATDIAGGSQFGYKLIWVLFMSNLMAILLQNLSARLGIVRGRDLAQANRETYPQIINISLYILAEIAIAACDLAEVLGMAIGIQLLTGIPLIYAVSITVLDTFLLLFLQRFGMRKMEAFILSLIAIVALSFLTEIILAGPHIKEVATGLVPSLPNKDALYIAIGIIGATVMPHNLYLHSALVQTRKIQPGDENIKKALKLNFLDSSIALNLAFLVNAAILILAATAFFKHGNTNVAQLKEAYQLLPSQLGTKMASTLFAIALIAAGQSSTITGTLAGQIIMEGYLQLRINPWLRRLLTRLLAIIPSIFVIIFFGEEKVDSLLVLSQVILSVQLGFAIIPLIHFVSDKKSMGQFSIKKLARLSAWIVASVLIYLNIKLVYEESAIFFLSHGNWFWKIIIVLGSIFLLFLLAYILVYPWIEKRKKAASIQMHAQIQNIKELKIPLFNQIAIALDFSEHDEKLLEYAIGQGNKNTNYVLIHIVESASARMLGKQSDDYETRKDAERLNFYKQQMEEKGFHATISLGYQNRKKELVKIIKEENADMLVIGAHGHSGLKDFIFGETVDSVRHELKIPVLIVNL
ncbi:MAG TPA: Nramp family divalent metal transporter [Puia sp.]|nr:Nramp family divalent metal transporter [Puia sp.]